jgi:hypothetical protein
LIFNIEVTRIVRNELYMRELPIIVITAHTIGLTRLAFARMTTKCFSNAIFI